MRSAYSGLLLLSLCAVSPAAAQIDYRPFGMHGGGNMTVENEQPLRARGLDLVVLDPSGGEIPGATVQIQERGHQKMLVDRRTGRQGKFRVGNLPAGDYWLGISAPGFNLHIWQIIVPRHGVRMTLRVTLSLGV